jgi:hypothetical protein
VGTLFRGARRIHIDRVCFNITPLLMRRTYPKVGV